MAAVVMADRVAVFVESAAGQRFRWGDRNCGLWIADWIAQETGEDPAADWRGACDDGEAVRARLEGEGGLSATVARRLAGLARVGPDEAAQAGDVGMVAVMTPDGPGAAVGLCQGDGFWAVLTARGVMSARLTASEIWRLPCRTP